MDLGKDDTRSRDRLDNVSLLPGRTLLGHPDLAVQPELEVASPIRHLQDPAAPLMTRKWPP
ncbi:hypothetical protein [Mycobacterium terramassiliense]|uniref:Mycobacterium terramassiliense ORFan n=1 Tax=Mycobacterium terramassiliense TaxID=1841859 RepID=A0A2U3NFP4_9MYCO|nr:hypothetical protein [Mycobacterium terramassiliense]SPM30342.1 Mycobacterium terramassiliense ORFan [Mycobacterium terramassiliense]